MQTNFFPNREADIVTWTNNFKQKILADPGAFGITPELAAGYAIKSDAFVAAYRLAEDPGTDSTVARSLKRTAKKELEAEARLLGRIIRSVPFVTNAQRIDLGLSVRTSGGVEIAAPAMPPILHVKKVDGRTVSVRLSDAESPTRRGKPKSAVAAAIFLHVGDEPPQRESDWMFYKNTTDVKCDVIFPSGIAPGARVWLTARWFTKTQKNSPSCVAVGTWIQHRGNDVPGAMALAA